MSTYEVKMFGTDGVSPSVYKNDKAMSPDHVVEELNMLRAAVVEAHRVILHEMDSGRTPFMLKAVNGGKGLGYFESALI